VLPVVSGSRHGHQVGGTGDQQDVGDDVVVVGRDGARFGVAQGDGVGAAGEDLLVAAGDDQGFDDAGDGDLPVLERLFSGRCQRGLWTGSRGVSLPRQAVHDTEDVLG